jgi:hypothetical protein
MTMPPIRTTFRFYRGCTFPTEPIVLENPDGTPIDITGYTAQMLIWREDGDPETPLYDLNTTDGTLVITGNAGKIEGTIKATDADVAVDVDGEMWSAKLTLTNPNATPDPVVERVVEGWVIACK